MINITSHGSDLCVPMQLPVLYFTGTGTASEISTYATIVWLISLTFDTLPN